jgi:hypothetical protein
MSASNRPYPAPESSHTSWVLPLPPDGDTLAAAALAGVFALLAEERPEEQPLGGERASWAEQRMRVQDAPWPAGVYRWHEAERPW